MCIDLYDETGVTPLGEMKVGVRTEVVVLVETILL